MNRLEKSKPPIVYARPKSLCRTVSVRALFKPEVEMTASDECFERLSTIQKIVPCPLEQTMCIHQPPRVAMMQFSMIVVVIESHTNR